MKLNLESNENSDGNLDSNEEVTDIVFSTEWSKADLIKACDENEISHTGSKPVLMERLNKCSAMEKEKSSKTIRGHVRGGIGGKSSSERSSSLPDMFVGQNNQSIPIRSSSVSSNKSSSVITDKSLPQVFFALLYRKIR